MIEELMEDNEALTRRLREAHNFSEQGRDVATASFIEVWINETELRVWFHFEASHLSDSTRIHIQAGLEEDPALSFRTALGRISRRTAPACSTEIRRSFSISRGSTALKGETAMPASVAGRPVD